MHLGDPRFPPLLKGHAVKAPAQPLAHACRLAERGKLGAGDIVWSRNTTRAALAIVLEPEVALERALQMAPLMMVAFGDCLGTLCPPKVAVQYRWPQGILLNGTLAGDVRVAAPAGSRDAIPRWLVVAAELDIEAPSEDRQDWSRTTLAEEAGAEITRTDVLESLSAHFLNRLNAWQEDGFRAIHDAWLFRAEGRESVIGVAQDGARVEGHVVGLDEGANLLLRNTEGKVRSFDFLRHVQRGPS